LNKIPKKNNTILSRSIAVSPVLENLKFPNKGYNLNNLKENLPDLRKIVISPANQKRPFNNESLPLISGSPQSVKPVSQSPVRNIPKAPLKLKIKTNPLEKKNEMLIKEVEVLKIEIASLKKYEYLS
jgi:hypothetical protein